MLKSAHITILSPVLLLVCISTASSQTTVHGKLLNVDGRLIPKTVISIQQEHPGDIFSRYEDVHAEADGAYSLTLHEPGVYNITFRGIYHRSMTIPLLIVDQPSIEMDILLLPAYYNDGRYFEMDEYLEWIRVYGNFNNYDFFTGIPFTLNNDGSIRAFIPVTSDTMRYQVRGLGYGRIGATPLPPADEYQMRDDGSFETVRYRDLPDDSLEIRYVPGETIPFQRMVPPDAQQEWLNANGFISFKKKEDRYWVEPLRLIRYFNTPLPVIEGNVTSGLPADVQLDYLEKYYSDETSDQLREIKRRILTELDNPDINPHQRAILYVGYAAVLSRVEMRKHMLTHFQQTGQDPFGADRFEEIEHELNWIDEIKVDKEILLQIPDFIVPTHPVWNRAQMLPQFLLNKTDGHPGFIDYFIQIVKHHPHESTVQWMVSALVQEQAGEFNTVEEMEVYQIVVERFGKGDMARRAHEIFRVAGRQEQ